MSARLPGTINDIEQFGTLRQLPRTAISLPTLIVHGRADNVVPFGHAEAVQRMVRQAELLAVDGGGHVSLFTHLDLVREKVMPFLR